MHNSLKIIKTLLYSYSALHVSGTLAPIISSFLILHIHPPVTVCRWVGCIFQLWSVAKATVVTDQSWIKSCISLLLHWTLQRCTEPKTFELYRVARNQKRLNFTEMHGTKNIWTLQRCTEPKTFELYRDARNQKRSNFTEIHGTKNIINVISMQVVFIGCRCYTCTITVFSLDFVRRCRWICGEL
jgi:hypothetical protein